MLRIALSTALLACLLAPAVASASQVGFEGAEIVARADPGEPMALFTVRIDPAAGTLTAEDTTRTSADVYAQRRGAPRPGERCQTAGDSYRPVVVCPLAGAQGVRVEWAGAVPSGSDPVAGRKPMNTIVIGGSLPVVYNGSPSPEGVELSTDARVTADASDGDDQLNVGAPVATVLGGAGDDVLLIGSGISPTGPPSRVDAGPGNDGVEAGLSDGSTVLGGPGNDRLNVSTYNGDPATQGRQPIRRQFVDCGDGADTVFADARDVAGAGCVATPKGLREGMTLGRFDRKGAVRVAVGRMTRPTSVRYGIFGSKTFQTSGDKIPYGKPAMKTLARVRGAVRAKVRTSASIRKHLRTRKKSVRGVRATLDLRRAGEKRGDLTSVVVGGVLRRGAP